MFDDAALALEEIEPQDKTRTEVLSVRVDLYIAARKWDMATTVAERALTKPSKALRGTFVTFAKYRIEYSDSEAQG